MQAKRSTPARRRSQLADVWFWRARGNRFTVA